MENHDHNNESGSNPKRTRIEVDVANLPTDPGLRIKISNYHPNERDQIRRHYLQNKPCQPVDHDFLQSQFGKTKHAAYCLFCYLFRPDTSDQGGGDSFVTEGFRNWKKKEKLQNHVGDHNTFRGHDESKDSNNQGNFLELLRFLANHNKEIDKATINAIIKDIGDSLFVIIVDESRDMSTKEQMAIALRYVEKLGHVNKHFLGITHVNNTSTVTLKSATEEVFNKHSLRISRLWGQGYDGASNMRVELNRLKTLILKDNHSAYYVHCFAHQLQLTLVAVAKNHIQIATFFNLVAKVFNIVGASYLEIHVGALVNLIHMFSSVIDVIETIIEDDQDIVNAMKLVDISKQRLQVMRDDGWNSLLEEVSAFCAKNNIDLFYTVIDMQLQELNSRFENSELLLCAACLNPDNLFSAFNKEKLIRLAQFYPSDFSTIQVSFLDNQLETYIHDMRSSEEFSALKGIGQLAEKMVEIKKNVSYPLVYSLVTLALILPVATATVERVFSAMNIIKNRLRNRIGDQWMNDCLATYIEKDIFKTIECEEIMQRFQNMKNCRGQLSKIS
ncbi:hypothetical protein ACB092_06G150000 [Castanea dentata]